MQKPNHQPSEVWEYQVRINLSEKFAAAARKNMNDPMLKPLADILEKYDAEMKNQFQAFVDYCEQAEADGQTDTVLYRWTKDLIEKPSKEKQYSTRFTIYADGGKEVYAKEIADALEADLQPLLESGMVTKLSKIDSNPANNPQAPRRFH